MSATVALLARIDELVALFNRRSPDLPDGLFDRRSQFLLNGTPFEAMLGREPTDPLVLMVARGPAGYRFAVKALQHAVPDLRVERANAVQDHGDLLLIVPFRLSGRLRGSEEPVDTVVHVTVTLSGETVARADAAIDAELLPPLRAARLLD